MLTHILEVTKKALNNRTEGRDGKTSDNVDIANGNFLDVVSVLREDLHPGALVASITHDELSRRPNHGNLARIPQLSLFPTFESNNTVFIFV